MLARSVHTRHSTAGGSRRAFHSEGDDSGSPHSVGGGAPSSNSNASPAGAPAPAPGGGSGELHASGAADSLRLDSERADGAATAPPAAADLATHAAAGVRDASGQRVPGSLPPALEVPAGDMGPIPEDGPYLLRPCDPQPAPPAAAGGEAALRHLGGDGGPALAHQQHGRLLTASDPLVSPGRITLASKLKAARFASGHQAAAQR